MSRIGKKPIGIDNRVKVAVNGRDLNVEGPKGTLRFELPACIELQQQESSLQLTCATFEQNSGDRALYGMARSMVNNMVIGVTEGFRKQLEIQGVGYRGQCVGSRMTLQLGYSHPIEFAAPDGISIGMPDNTHILIEGIDKQLVGQVAATIRGFRPPDAYKGKGIRYAGEKVSLKEGKTVG